MKLKRIISVMLSLAMLLSMVPMAFAAGETVATGSCGEGVTWTLDSEGTLTLSGNGGLGDYSQRGYHEYRDSIKKLVLEKGVNYLPERAFYRCPIEEIHFMGNCPTIEYNSFEGVTATAYYPDWNSSWFYTGDYGGDIRWESDGSEPVVELLGSGSCGDKLSWELTNLGTLTISGEGPMWDYEKGENPWYDQWLHGAVNEIVLEEGVSSVGEYAFCYFSNLSNVSCPESLEVISMGAFDDCVAFTLDFAHDGMPPEMGTRFNGCDYVKFSYPEKNVAWRPLQETFSPYNQTIKYVWEDNGLEVEDKVIFSEDRGEDFSWELTSLGTLTVSGKGPMLGSPWDNSMVNTAIIESGVTTVADYAFSGGHNVTSVSLPEGLVSIGAEAFRDCYSLAELDMPSSLESIGTKAFYYCYDIEAHFSGNYVRMEKNCFEGCTAKLYYPAWNFTWNTKPYLEGDVEWIDDGSEAKVEIIYSGEDHSGLGEISWELNNLGELRLHGWGKTGDWYTYGQSPWSELAGFIGSITVEPGINYIGDYAFANVYAEYVSIPGGMDELGDKVFYGCSHIQEIKFAGDAPDMSESSFRFATTYHTPVLSYPAGNSSWDRIADSNTYDLMPYEPDCTHSFGPWESYIEASCGSEGEERRYCSLCHTAEKRVSSIGDHSWDEGEVFIEPTETQTGKMEYTCTRCGELRLEDIPVLTPHEHEYSRGECTICGHSVLFEGWIAPDFAQGDYSFVAIPDTQSMVDLWPNEYYKQMKWIADNKEELNIQAVFHMGDMVESNSDGYWGIAKMGTDYLDRAGMVWMPMRGNHDDSEFFNKYYGSFANKSWFGESYEKGKLDHYYSYVNAGGREYLILVLGWAPSFSVLKWAQNVVESHPDKNVIIICHAYMNSDGSPLSWETDLSAEMRDELIANLPSGISPEMAMSLIPDGEDIWAAFKGYENVVLGLSGHVHSSDIVSYEDRNGAGKFVSSLLIDRQNDDINDHLGMVALLSFHEGSDKVDINWYSTRYDALYRASNQFTITVPHCCSHSYEAVRTEPSCTEEGYDTYVCSRCGASYVGDHSIPAAGHKWDEGISQGKETVYTCTVCGETRTEEVQVHEHKYTAAVTAPGCTAGGYTVYTCACGDSYKDDYTKAAGHKWNGGAVTKAPTEKAEGEKTYTCTVCGETRTETIAKLEHKHKYSESVTAPGCITEGYTTHTCSCGDSYKDNYTKAAGHKWDGGVITKAPTEKAEGEKTYTCTVCGGTRTETIAKLEHKHKYSKDITAPTCTTEGYTTHTCACGDSYRDTQIEALGHEWDSGKITLEPSKSQLGQKVYSCLACGETYTEILDRLTDVNDFGDIPGDAYYRESVDWALRKGITNGISDTLFGSNAPCTRAQVVTFLWRAAGEPEAESCENPFTDVKEGEYYYDAVLWAVEQGITTGISAVRFSPNSPCTRAQVVTFLWRAEGENKAESSKNPFKDVKAGDYYREAVLWAVENDITTGVSADSFGPNVTCTRGQIVTFLYRAFK